MPRAKSVVAAIALTLTTTACTGSDATTTSTSVTTTSTTVTTTTSPPVTTATSIAATTTTTAEAGIPIGEWYRVLDIELPDGDGDNQSMVDVVAGGPGLIAVGSEVTFPGRDEDAAVWTSIDGSSWRRVAHDEEIFGGDGDQSMVSIIEGGPGFVAVGVDTGGDGEDAAVWTSVDGTSWSRVADPDGVLGGTEDGDYAMLDIVVAGPGLVAVGWAPGLLFDQDAAVWTSTDGVAWERVEGDVEVFGLLGAGDETMIGVATDGERVVAAGWEERGFDRDAAVWVSDDGVVWSRVDVGIDASDPSTAMLGVAASGSGFVASGWVEADLSLDAALWVSADGLAWERVPNDPEIWGGEGAQIALRSAVNGDGTIAVGIDGPSDMEDLAVWVAGDGGIWMREISDTFGGDDDQAGNSVLVSATAIIIVGSDWSNGDNSDAAVWIYRF